MSLNAAQKSPQISDFQCDKWIFKITHIILPHSFAPSAISHQPRSPPHFFFKTAAEVNECGKATSTWDSSTRIVEKNLEYLILKESPHPNPCLSQSSPYIFQRTPSRYERVCSQIRMRLGADTNASAPRRGCDSPRVRQEV